MVNSDVVPSFEFEGEPRKSEYCVARRNSNPQMTIGRPYFEFLLKVVRAKRKQANVAFGRASSSGSSGSQQRHQIEPKCDTIARCLQRRPHSRPKHSQIDPRTSIDKLQS